MMPRRLHRVWLRAQCWSLCLDGTLTWFSGDDEHQRERKMDYKMICIPRWIWRPYCWWRGKHDDYYGCCVYCEKPMPNSPYRRRNTK